MPVYKQWSCILKILLLCLYRLCVAKDTMFPLCPVLCPDVSNQHRHFFASHERWTDFDEILGRESLPPTDELDYGLCEIGTRTDHRIPRKIRIDVNTVLPPNQRLYSGGDDRAQDLSKVIFIFIYFYFIHLCIGIKAAGCLSIIKIQNNGHSSWIINWLHFLINHSCCY